MKKRVSLSIFAILMTALLVFSGSVSVVLAKDESYSPQVTHRDTIGSPIEDGLSPRPILGWFGDEKITLKQIKDTLHLTDLHVDDETLEGILGHPIAPGRTGTLREAAEIAVIQYRYLEAIDHGIVRNAGAALAKAALNAAGYMVTLDDLRPIIPSPLDWIVGFFSKATDFWNLFQTAKAFGEAIWITRVAQAYQAGVLDLLLEDYRDNPFFRDNEQELVELASHYVHTKRNKEQIIDFRNSIADLIRERAEVYKAYQTGRYTGGVTADQTTVIVVNEGEYPIYDVVLINEIPLWPDERSQPFPKIDPEGGKGILSFPPGVDKIDHIEFVVMGAKLRIPFSIVPALPLIRTSIISPYGDYAPKEVEFDASRSFLSQGATLLYYEWDFGDGTRERGEKVSHKYEQPGSYTVSLRVSTTLGSSTTTKVIEVKNPVSAHFTVAPEDGPLGTVFQFDASASSTAVGNIVSYRWDFGDGSPAGEGIHVNHEYASEGFWTVTLTVTNDYGGSAVSRRTAFVGTRGPINIWGAIDHDVTWRPTFSPYILAGNVEVKRGAVLTILPGTEVRFKKGARLNVKGGLVAEGTKESPIIFTSHEPEPKPGDWGRLILSNKASLKNVVVEYGKRILVGSSDVTISNSIIRYNSYGGWGAISIMNSSPSIINNTITENAGAGISLCGSNATITGNTISKNSRGIWGRGSSKATITGNTIADNQDWAIWFTPCSSGSVVMGNDISGP
ncbi:PKD domain-containing protein, partial [Dehalococcoidia bacterium]|nr:PKD domain-containing protein [Dehalococcoidia bacterium]